MEEILIRGWDFNLPVSAQLRPWPEGQLSPRAGSMSLSQSATSQWGWDFHTVRGGIDPRDLRFHPRVVRVVDPMEEFLIRGWDPILPGVRWL